MNPLSIHSYVPESFYLAEKDKLPCRLFCEDLAVLLPEDGFRVLTARGKAFSIHGLLTLAQEDLAFWKAGFELCPRILVNHRQKPLLLFGDWFASCGLLLAMVPHADLGVVAQILPHVYHAKTAIAPSVNAQELHRSQAEAMANCYSMLSEQYTACDRMINGEEDFRLHAAHIAVFAGCLANVTELPIGGFPLSRHTWHRWSAFLLCLFLSLRGDSATPLKLGLDAADTKGFHMKLIHRPEAPRKVPIEDTLFPFLRLPCFSDFQLFKSEHGLILEAMLPRSSRLLLLQADLISETLCLEILPLPGDPKA